MKKYESMKNMKKYVKVWEVWKSIKTSYEKVCKNKDFCGIVISKEKGKILELNQYAKSDKMQYIFYVDIESLIRNMDGWFNNKNRWAYSLWILNVNNLGIWSHRKQTYFIPFVWKSFVLL